MRGTWNKALFVDLAPYDPVGLPYPKLTGTLHAIDVLHRTALLAFLSCISLYYIIFPSNGRLLVVCTPSYSPSKGCILVTPCRIKYAKQENDGNNRLLHIAMKSGVSQIRVYRHMATSNDDQTGTNQCLSMDSPCAQNSKSDLPAFGGHRRQRRKSPKLPAAKFSHVRHWFKRNIKQQHVELKWFKTLEFWL